jgi:hypothetical protein
MLSKYSIATYETYSKIDSEVEYKDKEAIEVFLNSATHWIETYLGFGLIERTYTEVLDVKPELIMKQRNVSSITSLLYDSRRIFDVDATTITNYFWKTDSRFILLFDYYVLPFTRQTLQVIYKSGYKRIEWYTEPVSPIEGKVWYDNGEFKQRVDGEWVVIEHEEMIPDKYIHALVELVKFNKYRIFSDQVGTISNNRSDIAAGSKAMELETPKNIESILTGENMLW